MLILSFTKYQSITNSCKCIIDQNESLNCSVVQRVFNTIEYSMLCFNGYLLEKYIGNS